ncbi:homeodomain-like protein [Artemisia annua]|uniref:Homeodomain-like protein n=1 Tax=Artemisia annua TaxID=35608 RepID=A0A2U1KNY0_ARTAN|nr:homeodomain-like protein [Artemisia annua]
MVKTSYYDKHGVKKGAWSEEEDNKLRAYMERYGHLNGRLAPKFTGVSRSGKSCRLRWMNHLRSNIKHRNFTKVEDNIIKDLHSKIGNNLLEDNYSCLSRWSMIAVELPGRSDNEIKDQWNTHLKKLVKKKPNDARNYRCWNT